MQKVKIGDLSGNKLRIYVLRMNSLYLHDLFSYVTLRIVLT